MQVQRRIFEQELERAATQSSTRDQAAADQRQTCQEVEDGLIRGMTSANQIEGDQMRRVRSEICEKTLNIFIIIPISTLSLL